MPGNQTQTLVIHDQACDYLFQDQREGFPILSSKDQNTGRLFYEFSQSFYNSLFSI